MSFGGYETNNGNPNKQVRCSQFIAIIQGHNAYTNFGCEFVRLAF